MTKIVPIVLASLLVAAPVFAETLTVPDAVKAQGKLLFDAAGSRLGVVDRVEADGSADILLDGRVIKIPSATLSISGGKLSTSLKKAEVVALR